MPTTYTTGQIAALLERVSNWGHWGKDDQRGALNYITNEKRAAAARLVQSGEAVSLSRPLPTQAARDNPTPVTHLMIRSGQTGHPLGSSGCADYFAIEPHGLATTHLDALCHHFWRGKMYNGFDTSEIDFQGAHKCGIDVARDGIISRGVLIDIPKIRQVEWVEPGDAIYPADLEAAERDHHVTIAEGDVMLLRTGRFTLRRAKGAGAMANFAMPGLHASCLEWLHDRKVAVLGSDAVSDVLPTPYEAPLKMPIHTGTLVMMGVHLIDNAELDPLAAKCARDGRYAFMFSLLPLVLERGTASPANPVALF
ncbi:MAG TPA: cyclase family protein [Candidatus Binataceae bacterium]|nr:cyclase family protein [Candidatus Binataceae bacterium]